VAALPYHVAINFAYYGRVVRWNIGGWNPLGDETFIDGVAGKFDSAFDAKLVFK